MEAPSFALIPSGFKSQKVYSVIPESGVGDLLFDRSNNTATRTNKDGLIESVAADIPRLNYEVTNGVVDSCPHLLLEMNSTNLVTYSEDFTQWATSGVTITANSSTSPDGKLNASLFSHSGGSFPQIALSGITFVNGANYAPSLYVKSDGTSQVQHSLIVNGQVVNFTPTNEWVRITDTIVSPDTSGSFVIAQNSGSAVAASFLIFGAQLEESSYATSYIPTSGSAQTRASESCTRAGDVNTFNSVEGILYAELKRDIATDTGFRRVVIDNANNNLENTVRLGYSTVTDEIKGVVTVGGATQCALVFAGLSVTSFRKMALLYKVNQFELWVDGSKRAEDTSGSTFPINTLNNLSFEQANGSDKLRAKVKDVRYYDTDGMSNTEITNLLTQLTQ